MRVSAGLPESATSRPVEMEPAGSANAGTPVCPNSSSNLNSVRQEIDYNLDEFNEIVNHKDFKNRFGVVFGDSLKRPPKGYTEDHLAIEVLKLKQFLVHHEIDKTVYLSESFQDYLLESFMILKPFLDFMNRPLDEYFYQEELA